MRTSPLRDQRSRPRIGRPAWIGGLLLAALTAVMASVAGPAAAAPRSISAPAQPGQQAQVSVVDIGQGTPPGQVTWSVSPATAKGPDNTRNLYNYGQVKPGSTIIDHVAIVNRSKQAAAFSLYATDATGTSRQDALLLLEQGKTPTDVGAWATFPGGASQMNTVIPGNRAVIVAFALKVPQLATPGDHTSAMVAAVGIPRKGKSGLAVVQNYRIAVPIELRVPGKLHAAIQIQSLSGGFSVPVNPAGDGSATISYTVANVGNVKQTGSQVVTVTGWFGQKATVRPANLPTILPGDSIRVTVPVPGLYPAGPMTAHVTVNPGWPLRTIKLAGNLRPVSNSASLFAWPWALLGLILLLIAIGFGIWWLLRLRGREHQAEVMAAAARASRETERRLLGRKPTVAAAAPAPGAAAPKGAAPGTQTPGEDASSETTTK
ncbi:MAG TPA: hypothetical protein VF060_29590 [Trebonia sp.]